MDPSQTIVGLGSIGLLIFMIVLLIFGLLMPLFVYSIMNSANRMSQINAEILAELKQANARLALLSDDATENGAATPLHAAQEPRSVDPNRGPNEPAWANLTRG